MYEIEKNVEIPFIQTRKYPFHLMEIGDSFTYLQSELKTARACMVHYMKKNGKKFKTMKISSTERRCWRIE